MALVPRMFSKNAKEKVVIEVIQDGRSSYAFYGTEEKKEIMERSLLECTEEEPCPFLVL